MLLATLARLRALRRRERRSRQRLLAHQAAALSHARAYAYRRSPFYQQFHRGLHGAPLAALPVLTKAALMEQFDALMTDREARPADGSPIGYACCFPASAAGRTGIGEISDPRVAQGLHDLAA